MLLLLPLKHHSTAKLRLGGVLSLAERGALVQAMASDLLQTLTCQRSIARIVVVSEDPRAAELAAQWKVEFLDESALDGARGLNDVVNSAARHLAARATNDLACIAGDLPLLTAEELSEFIRTHAATRGFSGSLQPSVTLAPDRWREGTNLIAWQPDSAFSVAFGPASMERHRQQAAAIGARFSLCESAGGGHDIDEPRDLHALAFDTPRSLAPHTRRYLNESGIFARLADARPAGRGREQDAMADAPIPIPILSEARR